MKKAMIIAIALLMVAILVNAKARGVDPELYNSPNPFNEQTTISVVLPCDSHVRLIVKDEKEHVLHTIFVGQMSAGIHSFIWDGTTEEGERLASGRYVLELEQQRLTSVKRIIILK